MTASTGFKRRATGSASTPKFSSAVAPSKYKDPSGPKITGQVRLSPSSGTVNRASPSSRCSRRPSARMSSRVRSGSTPISRSLSSGMNEYRAPVSTQKSSSKQRFGSFGFATATRTLNMPTTELSSPQYVGQGTRSCLRRDNDAPNTPESVASVVVPTLSKKIVSTGRGPSGGSAQRFDGKPRSIAFAAGSGQRDVTTFGRV